MDQTSGDVNRFEYVDEVTVVEPIGVMPEDTAPVARYGTTGDMTTDQDTGGDISSKRAEIEHTRQEMSATIDAIQQKLSPDTLAQQAKDTVREATIGKVENAVNSATDRVQTMVTDAADAVEGTGNSLIETIRENPIPAALAGIGLGWLLMSMRKSGGTATSYRPRSGGYSNDTFSRYGYSPTYGYSRPRTDYGYGNNVPGYAGTSGPSYGPGNESTGGVQGTINSAQDAASSAVNSAQDMASSAVDSVQGAAAQATDTAAQMAQQAQYTAQRTMSGLDRTMRQNPLAAGIVSLAVGAAIGLAIPETPLEDQFLGDYREQFMSQAQDMAHHGLQQAQNVAQDAVGAAQQAVKQDLKSNGNSGSSSSGQSGSSTSGKAQSASPTSGSAAGSATSTPAGATGTTKGSTTTSGSSSGKTSS